MYVATASPRPKRTAFDGSRGGNVPCVPPPPPPDPPLRLHEAQISVHGGT